ncbi:hypothetical protein K4F52_002961 [Lecanicillium sp. MT-2017a]|nr:hypothetical protein K4F52_002961 [Lecanicillium sp. MT-2017a]
MEQPTENVAATSSSFPVRNDSLPRNMSSAQLGSSTSTWVPHSGNQQPEFSSTAHCGPAEPYYQPAVAWDASVAPRSNGPVQRPDSFYQGQLPQTMYKDGNILLPSSETLPDHLAGLWGQKPYESLEFYPFDAEAPIGQAYTTDEAVPIIDLRFSNQRPDLEAVYSDHGTNRRSGSSLTMSTSGPLSDLPSYDDVATTLSEAPPFSDYTPVSNRTSLMSTTTHLSPVASPRATPHSRPDQVRTQSRGRASPSPRPSFRTAPYSTDGFRGNSRWSTGSYGTLQQQRSAPLGYGSVQENSTAPQRYSLQPSVTTMPTGTMAATSGNIHSMSRTPYLPSIPMASHRHSMFIPPHMAPHLPTQGVPPPDTRHLPQPPPLPSHGLLKMLQSNLDSHSYHGQYADLSDPPDLYPSLHEEPAQPPPEDMNPSDPDLVPYEQELRFDGDLYTPKLVRGHGNKREGWCGICKPGRWLVLKNSAYWYDKSFTHGISAATGAPFQEPLDKRRMDGNPDVWEGLCGSCNKWIALVSSKKKGTTWFRHAYKVHIPVFSSATKSTH